MNSLRLFVAFDTPGPIKHRALSLMDELKRARADVSWEREAKLHCTVKFLGNVEKDRLPALGGIMEQVADGVPPIRIRYGGIGFFPNIKSPKVCWIGVEDPTESLQRLFRNLEGALSKIGFPADDRPFHPHLTLGRIRSPRNTGSLIELAESCTFEPEEAHITAIALMQSELQPSGSIYTVQKSVPLVGNCD